MSKYNFDLDLDSENSLSIIIDMITPNSKILEFGPAHGRMTRHLKEKMNCQVDIVEIDEESGIEASKYANKYFLGHEKGNIESYLWFNELNDEKYDYIIFADVLEHLYWPEDVLKKCKKLLKYDGSIIISVPNISHNSVIIDMINDEFRYNDTGLLDNTHIRFFTYNSLIRMIDNINLIATKETATYSRVGSNEISSMYSSLNRDIARQLKKRAYGNIYQFIFELKHKEYYLMEEPLRSIMLDKLNSYEFVIYIKDKYTSEYNERNTIRKSISSNTIREKINLNEYDSVEAIRIDPITSNCIIDNIELYTNTENSRIDIPIKSTNCIFEYNGKYFFETDDPQIYVDILDRNIDNIIISYNINYYDITYMEDVKNLYLISSTKDRNFAELENMIDVKSKIINDKDEEIISLEKLMSSKDEEIISLKKLIISKDEAIDDLETSIKNKILKKIRGLKKE